MRGPVFFILLIIFISCGKKDKVPSGIIPKDKMQAVLWDMMRADQFLGDYVFNIDTTRDRKLESISLYREILALHKISQDEFRESFNYYRERPAIMRVIMDSISKTKKLPTIDTSLPRPAIDSLPEGELLQ